MLDRLTNPIRLTALVDTLCTALLALYFIQAFVEDTETTLFIPWGVAILIPIVRIALLGRRMGRLHMALASSLVVFSAYLLGALPTEDSIIPLPLDIAGLVFMLFWLLIFGLAIYLLAKYDPETLLPRPVRAVGLLLEVLAAAIFTFYLAAFGLTAIHIAILILLAALLVLKAVRLATNTA